MKRNPIPYTLNPSRSNSSRGFTLLEILVAVSIVAILSSVIIVGLSQIQARGRDTRRVKDLSEVQHALELYFAQRGEYPGTMSWSELQNVIRQANLGVSFLPNDPSTGRSYGYCRGAGATDRYVLAAHLDDANNPNLSQYPNEVEFPCTPTLRGTPGDGEQCSKRSGTTSKYCLFF